MNRIFRNKARVIVLFTDEGIIFYDPRNAVYMPYGCIDSIKLSLLGVLQVTSLPQICNFAVDRQDRAELKKAIAEANHAVKNANRTTYQVFELAGEDDENYVSSALPLEEQLRRYKGQFVRGAISHDQYEIHRKVLQSEMEEN